MKRNHSHFSSEQEEGTAAGSHCGSLRSVALASSRAPPLAHICARFGTNLHLLWRKVAQTKAPWSGLSSFFKGSGTDPQHLGSLTSASTRMVLPFNSLPASQHVVV